MDVNLKNEIKICSYLQHWLNEDQGFGESMIQDL